MYRKTELTQKTGTERMRGCRKIDAARVRTGLSENNVPAAGICAEERYTAEKVSENT